MRVITCAENDALVMPVLLHGTAHAARGADEDLRRGVAALRARFPDVRIHLRADAGFAVPRMYEVCEELQVDYTIAIGMNSILKKESETLLAEAVAEYEKSKPPQCLFTRFDYQAGSWPQPRQVAIKGEARSNGTNRRAVVSNRPGISVLPGGVYGEYADRRESENRNKELKCELGAGRLSGHRYRARCFRMCQHVQHALPVAEILEVLHNGPTATSILTAPPSSKGRHHFTISRRGLLLTPVHANINFRRNAESEPCQQAKEMRSERCASAVEDHLGIGHTQHQQVDNIL